MQGANIDKLIRYARPVKIATVALGCVITVASIVVSNCGSSDSVSLQMPARYTEDRSSRLGYVDTKPAHQRFDLDKYTYVADDVQFALENFKQEEPSAELKYDGNKYRV